mmetsp:Transcript_8529/g.20248  ORF Transcript_8529/g.20248 Transcript_8529/m.20248 type:complete len:278 (-) Transcript_8529:1131-1964(-)
MADGRGVVCAFCHLCCRQTRVLVIVVALRVTRGGLFEDNLLAVRSLLHFDQADVDLTLCAWKSYPHVLAVLAPAVDDVGGGLLSLSEHPAEPACLADHAAFIFVSTPLLADADLHWMRVFRLERLMARQDTVRVDADFPYLCCMLQLHLQIWIRPSLGNCSSVLLAVQNPFGRMRSCLGKRHHRCRALPGKHRVLPDLHFAKLDDLIQAFSLDDHPACFVSSAVCELIFVQKFATRKLEDAVVVRRVTRRAGILLEELAGGGRALASFIGPKLGSVV